MGKLDRTINPVAVITQEGDETPFTYHVFVKDTPESVEVFSARLFDRHYILERGVGVTQTPIGIVCNESRDGADLRLHALALSRAEEIFDEVRDRTHYAKRRR